MAGIVTEVDQKACELFGIHRLSGNDARVAEALGGRPLLPPSLPGNPHSNQLVVPAGQYCVDRLLSGC